MNMKNVFAMAMIAGLAVGTVAQADHHEGKDEKAAHGCKGKGGCGKKKKAKADAAAPAEGAPAATGEAPKDEKKH